MKTITEDARVLLTNGHTTRVRNMAPLLLGFVFVPFIAVPLREMPTNHFLLGCL